MKSSQVSGALKVLDSGFARHGFCRTEARHREWAQIARWERRIEELDSHQYVEIDELVSERDAVSVGVEVGLCSAYATLVENEARLWECGSSSIDPRTLPYKSPRVVVKVSLNWLSLTARPEEGRSMWRLMKDNVGDEVAILLGDFQRFGLPFLARTTNIDSLRDLLLNLVEAYPSHLQTTGLYSWDEVGCCAILLHRVGRVGEALDVLEGALTGGFPTSVIRSFGSNAAARRVVECRLRRIREYLLQETDR